MFNIVFSGCCCVFVWPCHCLLSQRQQTYKRCNFRSIRGIDDAMIVLDMFYPFPHPNPYNHPDPKRTSGEINGQRATVQNAAPTSGILFLHELHENFATFASTMWVHGPATHEGQNNDYYAHFYSDPNMLRKQVISQIHFSLKISHVYFNCTFWFDMHSFPPTP